MRIDWLRAPGDMVRVVYVYVVATQLPSNMYKS
jgi:hypothetical protein